MLSIRPEMPQDIPAIAALQARAFGYRAGEPVIVMLHRQRREFDHILSLVAELDGRIIGHALFSPRSIRLLGQPVRAVNLAPIAVEPAQQRRGIGAALMQEGHRVARAKGYSLSFLLGHPTYYPRFGYRTRVYGTSWVLAYLDPADARPLEVRPVREDDVPELHDLWLHEEGGVDFAIDPGLDMVEWLSPNPGFEGRVYLEGGQIIGYTRGPANSPRLFLARNAGVARAMAALIADGKPEITLPLHPYSASASAFGTAECEAWDAGMAVALATSPFDEFCARLAKGERQPGRPIWPVEFDLG